MPKMINACQQVQHNEEKKTNVLYDENFVLSIKGRAAGWLLWFSITMCFITCN